LNADVRRTLATVVLALQIVGPAAQSSSFVFQNNFWVNLHHFLRAEERRQAAGEQTMMASSTLSATEREAWHSALDAYAESAKRDPLQDDRFVQVTNILARAGETEPAFGPIAESIRTALRTAGPIYRTHRWPADTQVNEAWIAAVRPRVDQHGGAMVKALAAAYRVEWPEEPLLVDASTEAGPLGGYTTDGPPGTAAHTIIAAGNPSYQGDMAFEMVFHEASHAAAVGDRIIKMVAAESARQHLTPPRDLWHAIIFYTSGELARRELGKSRDPDYRPYAYRYGVYSRGWDAYRVALERDWRPYLDGAKSFEVALRDLVRDCASP
jgi:hypothetical protein